jgi:hypothetical protein
MVDKSVLIARGRLKEAHIWFAHRGWDTLPQGRRGQKILAWCAIQAWLGYPHDPEAGVRRKCGGLAPYLKEAEWIELIAETRVANKHFNHDQCALVLEISVIDCLEHGFKFLGADNDMNYGTRHKAKRARNAACQRKRRAACSTGRMGGRPALQLSEEDRLARRRAQGAERKRAERERKKVVRDVTLNPVTGQDRITGEVTVFSVTSDRPSRARPSASRPPIIINTQDRDNIDADGDAFGAPPPTRTDRRPIIPF